VDELSREQADLATTIVKREAGCRYYERAGIAAAGVVGFLRDLERYREEQGNTVTPEDSHIAEWRLGFTRRAIGLSSAGRLFDRAASDARDRYSQIGP